MFELVQKLSSTNCCANRRIAVENFYNYYMVAFCRTEALSNDKMLEIIGKGW